MSKESRSGKPSYPSRQHSTSTKRQDIKPSITSKPNQQPPSKSKTFSITKSYTPSTESQTYKKYILPQLNNLKKLQKQKRRDDEMREKLLQQHKMLLKQQQKAKERQEKQLKSKKEDIDIDMQKGIYIDRDGRTRDAFGNLVLIQNDVVTTAINKKLMKQEQLKEMERKNQNKLYDRVSKTGFHDNNIVGTSKNRLRRALGGLQFEEEDEESGEGGEMREEGDKLGKDLMDLLTAPKAEKAVKKIKKIKRTKLQTQDLIPDKQWWDNDFVKDPSYFPLPPADLQTKQQIQSFLLHNLSTLHITPTTQSLNLSLVTDSVPQFDLFPQVQQKTVVMPVFLTKDQKKKMKRIRKRERLQEKNDKIKLGIIQPDKPKLKISNMALVMKEEYIIDPSRVELDVRKQIQQRVDTHNQTNESRKLTKQKRAQKAMRKLKRDSAKETRIAVFKINDVRDRTHRFKIEMNAKQLALNGLFLFPGDRYKGPAVIVAEGGRRAIKFYKNLLLGRINWSEIDRANLFAKEEEGEGIEKQEEVGHEKMVIRNKCRLVWEAVVTDKLFSKWRAVQINNDTEAIRALAERKAEHFWDMIINFKQQS